MESDHDRPPSPEFSPLDISEDLVPSRPPKIAGQTSVSFSGLLEPPLLLHEDLKEGCGGQLWPAGMVLAEYLLKDVKKLRGKVMYGSTFHFANLEENGYGRNLNGPEVGHIQRQQGLVFISVSQG